MPDAAERVPIIVTVNGKPCARQVEPRLLLVDFIREDLGLTGTHVGCDTTYCGACTVLLNGASVKSCTVLAVQADQGEVMTVEGLAPLTPDGGLHPIQQAFAENYGLQCGYCTPGLLMSVYQLLSKNPQPTANEIRKGIAGNCCRCTGYQGIFRAVESAAKQMQVTSGKWQVTCDPVRGQT